MCHLYPLVCTFALSGRITGVNLYGNIQVGIYTFNDMAVGCINRVATLKGIIMRKCMGFSLGQNKAAIITWWP